MIHSEGRERALDRLAAVAAMVGAVYPLLSGLRLLFMTPRGEAMGDHIASTLVGVSDSITLMVGVPRVMLGVALLAGSLGVLAQRRWGFATVAASGGAAIILIRFATLHSLPILGTFFLGALAAIHCGYRLRTMA